MKQFAHNQKPKVSIVIVTWNAERFMPYVFASLDEQTFQDFNVLVIDNASADGTVDLVNNQFAPRAKVVQQKQNVGFSRGYNLGIHWSDGEYVLIMNQDVVLDPDFLQAAVSFMDNNKKVGALQGKILQWDIPSNRRLQTVDNLGIALHANHSFTNRYEGEPAPKEEREASPVFAFCGSCVLIRRETLKDVADGQEYFDESFFMYKEDIDLSWRMRHAHWDIVYVPTAVAYHGRTLKDVNQKSNLAVAAHRVTKPKHLNYMSYRNHWYVLIKNEFAKNMWHFFPQIFWYEFRKLGYTILAETRSLKALIDIVKSWPQLFKKRKQIMKNSHITAEEIRNWIT